MQARALALEVACERLQRCQAVDLLAQYRRRLDHHCELLTAALQGCLDLPMSTLRTGWAGDLRRLAAKERAAQLRAEQERVTMCMIWSSLDGTAQHLVTVRIEHNDSCSPAPG